MLVLDLNLSIKNESAVYFLAHSIGFHYHALDWLDFLLHGPFFLFERRGKKKEKVMLLHFEHC
jgi:hypothetical protein